MKRFAYYIACCTLVVLCACTHDDTDDVIPAGNGKITIQASLDDMAITRADVKDTQAERKITHIDVFAVDSDGKIDYYERNTAGNNNGANEDGSGVLTLNVARRAMTGSDFVFAQDEEYKFYLVANATAAKSEMEAIKTLAALQQLVQNDSFIPNETGWTGGEQTLLHLTGTTGLGVNPDKVVPETFLMDAVATDAQSNDAFVVNSSEGNLTNLNLSAEFKRAAAKIIVNITQGEDVEFHTKMKDTTGTEETSQYDFIELPASTFVLPSDENLVGIKRVNTNPMVPNDQTFVWASEEPAASNSIQVVGYAYAHFWDNANLKNETSLILNIPMMWNKDNNPETGYSDGDDKPNVNGNGKEAAAPRSWYKVPLSKDKKFERNKCYVVNVTINAVGAANRSTAIELENIEYKTLDWVGVSIDVGNDENRPAYLELNTDLVEIYNANFDNTSLSFSSSSAITSITLKDVYKQNDNGTFTSETDNHDAYYINKFGVKTHLNDDIRETISATAEENVLNGAISILSPIVPAKSAEIEKLILEQLGPAPTAPTLTEPTYDGTIVPEPPFVAEPNPQDYVKATSYNPSNLSSNNISWTEEETAGWPIEYWTKRSCTQTFTEYEYSLDDNGNPTFYKRTGTIKVTQTRNDYWDDIKPTYGNITYTSDRSADTTTQNAWDTAWGNYQTYLTNKAAYDAQQEEPDFQAYLAEKQAYDNAWAEYNDELADYNEEANAIREAAKGEETHYNTIRYLEFEVTNEQGMKATFRVMQYPVVYITNIQGWYSYREDFGGTTLENKGTNTTSNSYFKSKVAFEITTGNNRGQSNIYQYSWNKDNTVNEKYDDIYTPGNARMYHVKITATSDEYTLGKPRLDAQGYTESSAVNNKLVSPSFMLASQLGALAGTTFSQVGPAQTHCQQYVEVYKDKDGKKVVLDDWRIPTRAELEIIIKYQYSSDAMDEVIRRKGYWCADGGQVTNTQGMDGTGYLRCIRDAY